MDDNGLTLNSIISIGFLATSLVIGTEMPTDSTLLGPEVTVDSEYQQELVLDANSDYFKSAAFFTFPDGQIKINMNSEDEDYLEPGIIEIPVYSRINVKFKPPVTLEFA